MYTPDDPGNVLLSDFASGVHLYSIKCKLSSGIALSMGIRNNVTRIHPEMVFFANLSVSLHVCLCGDHQVASVQPIDFLDIGKPGTAAKRWD